MLEKGSYVEVIEQNYIYLPIGTIGKVQAVYDNKWVWIETRDGWQQWLLIDEVKELNCKYKILDKCLRCCVDDNVYYFTKLCNENVDFIVDSMLEESAEMQLVLKLENGNITTNTITSFHIRYNKIIINTENYYGIEFDID